MSQIQVLSPVLSNQLAAGEVLERASSAIKELIENSLDAGATAIEIEIEDGGKKRMMVSDNGCGMTMEDAKLCILRHATSKIRTTQDLAAIATMGFRGEALASMAAVARMTITTQRRDEDMGTFLRVEGAEILECRETAAPVGTQIVLEDLFFNTPARLKFLKTTQTESRKIFEEIEKFAIVCPEVHWKLTTDGRVKCDWPAQKTLKERALSVFGRTVYDSLYPIEPTTVGNVMVDGLFGSPEFLQTTNGRIYTFVNHRIVRDKTITSAIGKAYREFLHGKQPCVVLFISLPLNKVDVNVHPTKLEVRFQDPDEVFHAVYRALRQSLEKTPWIRSDKPASTLSPDTRRYFEMLPDSAFRTPEDNMRRDMGLTPEYVMASINANNKRDEAQTSNMPKTAVERDVEDMLSVFDGPQVDTEPCNMGMEAVKSLTQPDFGSNPSTVWPKTSGDFQLEPERRVEYCEPKAEPVLPLEHYEQKGYFSSLRYIGQHAMTYLICADGDNLVIIDQHAAHERINYERLRRVADKVLPPDSQGLLFPILMSLDTRLSMVLIEHLPFFQELGFQIDEMGNRSFAIRAVPKCLDGYDYAALIRDALTDLGESGRATQFEDIRDNILATMACHSSIRSGQAMSVEEVRELLRLMDSTGFRSNCPHGRPVHFVLSISELEKRFLRIGYSGIH
ncbi:MAG: DNA mismatch repair endonuclease MutL [Proteobacteria bacterium]|nr:DNA mismatch repair endonuclease MutL [Pseudomonadota bacterium]